MPVFPTTVLDTTGAGDTFSGMLAASLTAGTDLRDAMRTASAAAAISVSRALAEGAAPSAKEIAAFLAAQQDDAEAAR
jgi:ribokinase